MSKQTWYIIIGALLFYVFFIRKKAISVGGTVGAGLVPTGAAATPYSGYPPGYGPPATGAGGVPQGNYGPGAPVPIVYQQQGDTTGSTLAGVGALLGGVGTAVGSILGGLGSSGILGGSSGGGSSGDSYDFAN